MNFVLPACARSEKLFARLMAGEGVALVSQVAAPAGTEAANLTSVSLAELSVL